MKYQHLRGYPILQDIGCFYQPHEGRAGQGKGAEKSRM